jgi:hypothetical protein
MAAHTMSASTFLNTMQIDFEEFHKETLEAISYVRTHLPVPQPGKPSQRAHA